MQPPRGETGDHHFLLAGAGVIHSIAKQTGRNPRHSIASVPAARGGSIRTLVIDDCGARCVPGETL